MNHPIFYPHDYAKTQKKNKAKLTPFFLDINGVDEALQEIQTDNGSSYSRHWGRFDCLKIAIYRLLLAFGLVVSTSVAYAETCQAVGGCVGNVWYIHVPKAQFQSRKIFDKASLPNVNNVEALSKNVSLLDSYAFVHPPYPEELRQDIKRTIEQGVVLTGWGSILRAGSKVKILSYQTFPTLGDMGNELFALVLVMSD